MDRGTDSNQEWFDIVKGTRERKLYATPREIGILRKNGKHSRGKMMST
jgi:hypothetical protein